MKKLLVIMSLITAGVIIFTAVKLVVVANKVDTATKQMMTKVDVAEKKLNNISDTVVKEVEQVHRFMNEGEGKLNQLNKKIENLTTQL